MTTVILVLVLVVLVGGGIFWWARSSRQRAEQALGDARADAQRWYERLGGQVMNLVANDDTAVKQALVDAGERYNAAGSQLDQSKTTKQFELAGHTALEGLYYARAARTAMGLDPGPDLPPMPGQRTAGQLTQEREVTVEGKEYRARPQAASDTPYYYPGGMVGGRPVPGGWYSDPWWKTALVAGASGIGTALLFNAFMTPGFGGYGGYDSGFADGMDYADNDGGGDGGDGGGGGGDMGGDGGGWFDGDGGGFGDFGGDFGG
ncbi:MAG: hypothetical protein WCA46_28725 [Actinocatenispora sp.]